MHRLIWLALPFLLFIGACSGLPPDYTAADAPSAGAPAPLPTDRPSVALVLGGGASRSFAQVGVIKALDAAGIVPDLVVGTSSGALVGALYAAGLSGAELERRALELDPMDVFDFTFNKFGKVRGQALQDLVNTAVQGRPIEKLPRAFAAVASRVPTGEMTVFNRGNTGLAVRASSAIIGTFVPVVIRGATYYDGDLVSPVPVLAAKMLGADVIIAVDVSADLRDTPPLENIPLKWLETGIMRKSIVDIEARLAAVLIRPRLPYYAGRSDAYKRLAIAAGEAATRAVLSQIKTAIAHR